MGRNSMRSMLLIFININFMDIIIIVFVIKSICITLIL